MRNVRRRHRLGRQDPGGPAYFSVKGEGRVLSADTRSRVGVLFVDVAPFDRRADVSIQIGPVLRGTALRDATGFVRFAGGASLSLEASWACHRAENEFMETHLYGTKAGLVQRNVGGGYQFEAYAYEYRSGAFYDCRMARTVERERSPMEHFADAILAGQPAPASGAQGLIVQEILDALYRSAVEGKPVQIKAGRSKP